MTTSYVAPLWRYFIAALDGSGITDFSRLASDRVVEVILNAPLSITGTVPSDNPQVWTPYDDAYDDPYLAEGTRLVWGFRRESDTAPYYTVRAATLCQLVEDTAQQDDARTRFVGWDPWHYMLSRPCLNYYGELPGPDGLQFVDTQAATIIEELLSHTYAYQGTTYIDLPETRPDSVPNEGASGLWAGTIETGAGMAVGVPPDDPFVIPQGTSVGAAIRMLTDMGICDVIMNPIYDPTRLNPDTYLPNYLVELNVYAQAGQIRDEAIFAWNLPGRNVVGLTRQQDGNVRANAVKFFAGQGGSATDGQVIPVQEDTFSQTKYGVYYAQQFFPGQIEAAAVESLAQQQLELRKLGRQTVTLRPAPERSPRPWQDYQLGDRVPVWASAQKFRQLLKGTT